MFDGQVASPRAIGIVLIAQRFLERLTAMNRLETQSQRLEVRWLVAIVLAGFLFRVVTVIVLDFQPESDYAAYQSMALNLLAGKGIIDSMGNYAMYNVGYPLFLLAPVFALFGKSLLAAQLANSILGLVGVVLCYAIAREAGAGRIGRLLAAAMWALYLPSWVYAEYLAKENLMTPVILGVIWCSLRLSKRISVGVAAGCGLLFGLLALTGNSGLALTVVAALALVFAPESKRHKLHAATIVVLAGLSIASPWMIRNLLVLGSPVLNTNGGFNLYLGNNPAASGHFVDISDTPRGPTWEALRREGEVQASETLRRDAIFWIQEHPTEFVNLAFQKAVLFWTPPIHEGKGPQTTMENSIRKAWLMEFMILAMATISCLLLPELRTRSTSLLVLGIGSYTAVHMLFYVIFRYREPIMPILCVLAALFLEAVWVTARARASSAGLTSWSEVAPLVRTVIRVS
jgi:hypothetical protein